MAIVHDRREVAVEGLSEGLFRQIDAGAPLATEGFAKALVQLHEHRHVELGPDASEDLHPVRRGRCHRLRP